MATAVAGGGGGRLCCVGCTYGGTATAQVEERTLIHPFDDPLVIAGQGVRATPS
eukprot:COSAG01_NODE_11982_length_1823_cov_33.000520_2_plen_54_part_00